jgi:hypothetical protein
MISSTSPSRNLPQDLNYQSQPEQIFTHYKIIEEPQLQLSTSFYFFFLYKVYREMKDVKNIDPSFILIVHVMKEKFLKYREEFFVVTIIVSYLHSSFKKKYTILMFHRYKNNLCPPYTKVEARMTNLSDDMFNIYNFR